MRRPLVRLFLGVITFAWLTSPSSGVSLPDSAAPVWTLAGSGKLGIDDGPAARASFLMPVAVAYGPRGELYVADEAAQRVKKVENGVVETIAGSGPLDSLGLHVAGGYQDGPALSARFDDPIALAVSPAGDVYVADSANHCIRRISRGFVTTVAGSPDRKTQADGPATSAAFSDPHGLAFDGDGILYVADFGAGIRRVSKDGGVTTIAKESLGSQRLVAISAVGHGPHVTLYADDLDGRFAVVHPSQKTIALYDDNDAEGGGSLRLLYGLAPVGDDQFLATDLKSSSIRVYRLPEPPFVGRVSGPIVVGAASDDASETAGDVDGDYESARFYDPLGLAVYGNSVAVADTGNRKIREVRMPQTRRSISLSNLDALQRTNAKYRILYIGSSYNFFGTSWDQSIAGILERELNTTRQKLGLTHDVEVETVRIDSANIGLQEDFVSEYVPPGAFDLIIFGNQAYFLGRNEPIDGHTGSEAAGIAIAKLQRLLGNRTKLLVFVYPEYAGDSFVDGIVAREVRGDQSGSAVRSQIVTASENIIERFKPFASPVPVYSSLDRFAALDATGQVKQLWPADGAHESAAGRRAAADGIYNVLEESRPWRKS